MKSYLILNARFKVSTVSEILREHQWEKEVKAPFLRLELKQSVGNEITFKNLKFKIFDLNSLLLVLVQFAVVR